MNSAPQNQKLDALVARLDSERPPSCENATEQDIRNTAALVCSEMREGLYPVPSRVLRITGLASETPGSQRYVEALLAAVPDYLLVSLDVSAQTRMAYLLTC